ncbi:hypothetical protein AVEN_239620-1 [Araneus ventricosus]|uniref:Mariner Mos1 transposase n=1 Tax=Araneus ventricosus TaxID=182803 RepID=A0A4Y2RQU2_ARAVE|nr:hypothetical protein AVEN_239620-1 [Araneus ventricosus]
MFSNMKKWLEGSNFHRPLRCKPKQLSTLKGWTKSYYMDGKKNTSSIVELSFGKTTIGEYYAYLLDHLNKGETTSPSKKKIRFHHHNALAHTSEVVRAKLHDFTLLSSSSSSYSPAWSLWDYYLSPNMKN